MLSILVFGLALAMVGPRSIGGPGTGTAEASGPGADGVHVYGQHCLSLNQVQVNLGWLSGHQGPQWVDLSNFDNGFTPGTFTAMGPYGHDHQAAFAHLRPNTVYFVRVNTLTPWGWIPTFNVFVTMGCQHLVSGVFVPHDRDSDRNFCHNAHGRWDNGKCVFVRFIIDLDKDRHDRDKHRDHDRKDRDRDRDRCDRDNFRGGDWDKCDRDDDRDDCDRNGNDFNRGGRDHCDRDNDDNDWDWDDKDNDDNDGPRPCFGQQMENGRCRPMTSTR